MNILSFLSTIVFTCYAVKVGYCFFYERKSKLYLPLILICTTLGWWSFCNIFFFCAQTKEIAWFWHKIGSFGWVGFVPATIYYYVVLTNNEKKISNLFKYSFFLIIPSIFILQVILKPNSPMALDLVQSTLGYGWTYINEINSISFILIWIYINTYFTYAFYILKKWSRENKYIIWKKKRSKMFIGIDIFVLAIGEITDFILPLYKPYFPPIANICTIVFLGFYVLVMARKHNAFSMDNIASPKIILETITEPIIILNEDGNVVKLNKPAVNMLKESEENLLYNNLDNFYEEPQYIQRLIEKVFNEDTNIENKEIKIIDKQGNVIIAIVSVNIASNKNYDFLGVILAFKDITYLKKIENDLRISNKNYKKLIKGYSHLANYDELTNLPNRRLFFKYIDEAVVNYKKQKIDFGVIYCDIDKFKQVNDTYGHQIGDKILVTVAKRLKKIQQKDDLVARIGGDEFVIFISGNNIKDRIQSIINNINYIFREKVIMKEFVLDINISLGTAIYSEIGNIDKMLETADKHMYNYKKNESKTESFIEL